MRSNIEGAELRGNMIWEKNRLGQVKAVLAATHTMAAKSPHLLFLDANGAARTVVLPAEDKGLWYVIFNVASGNFDLTVKEDSSTTTIGIVQAGQALWFFCDGTTWLTMADQGTGSGAILIGDVTAYTVLAANSGRLHIVPDVTSSVTITLPTPDEGLEFRFIYGGVAADAQNHLITGGAGNFLKGNIEMADLDAGAGADEMSAVFGNGTSHVTLTITTPASYDVTCWCDGALWYVTGRVLSNTACGIA